MFKCKPLISEKARRWLKRNKPKELNMTTKVTIEACCNEKTIVKVVMLDLETHFEDIQLLENGQSTELYIYDECHVSVIELPKNDLVKD